jgi:hypothetical protein
LLAVLIAFPDQASRFLLEIGDLAPDAPSDRRRWAEYARDDGHPKALREFAIAATDLAANTATSTREPCRRWALEISRYSFATGQEVFATYHRRCRSRNAAHPGGRLYRSSLATSELADGLIVAEPVLCLEN